MKHLLKAGFSFEWTVWEVTALGLMTELQAGTHSRLAVTGGIVPFEGTPVVPHVRTLEFLAGRTAGKLRSIGRKIQSRKEVCDEGRTLWGVDGARRV